MHSQSLSARTRRLRDIRDRISRLDTADGSPSIPGCGPIGAAAAIVGQDPCPKCVREGRPFVGGTASHIEHAMKSLGYGPESISDKLYLTNAIYWHIGIGKSAPETARRACQDYLAKELEAVSPVLIICWGTVAAKSVRAIYGTRNLGWPFAAPRGGAAIGYGPWITTAPHPGYFRKPVLEEQRARQRQQRDEFDPSMEAALRWAFHRHARRCSADT